MDLTTTLSRDDNALAGPLENCREQQSRWSALSVRERLQPVRDLRRLLVASCDELCAAVREDLDKSVEEVISGELLPIAAACKFLQRQAAALLRPRKYSLRARPLFLWGQSDTIHRRPRGIVGIIGTWNFPLLLNGVQIIQALTAGNGVI